MTYEVYNDQDRQVTISDTDIENAIMSDQKLGIDIVQAMGKSHNRKYLPYIYPYLYSDDYDMRTSSAKAIMNIDGKAGLCELKKRECLMECSETDDSTDEKAILLAMIIRLERGISGVKDFLLNDGEDENVKYEVLYYFESGYLFKEEDVELICFAMDAFVDKDMDWIRQLSYINYSNFLYFAFESLWIAGMECDVLQGISDELSDNICVVIQKLMDRSRLNNDTKEIVAEISKYMRKEYALRLLKLLMGHVKGVARRAYKQSLKQWQMNEEDL